jgi:hypothetical protein
MKFFFIDDSKQNNPSRAKLGPLVGVGGIIISDSKVKSAEESIEQICKSFEFPEGEIFKWSPSGKHWMRKNLIDDKRKEFQIEVIKALKTHDVRALFICDDKNCSTAEDSNQNHEMDVVKLLLERIEWHLGKSQSEGLIIVDRPSGNYKKEEEFLLDCMEVLKAGTTWMKPERVIMSVLSSPTKLSRLLQAADLIVSSTMSYVSGEGNYSEPIFKEAKDLFLSESGRIGGVGAKLHPFMKFVNLYHWLFGDTHYIKANMGYPLPMENYAFSENPNDY